MLLKILVGAACVAIIAAGAVAQEVVDASDSKLAQNSVAAAIKAITADLRDPYSAKLSSLQYGKDANFVCGYVNAKNGFGGYVGATKFYVNVATGTARRFPTVDEISEPRMSKDVIAGRLEMEGTLFRLACPGL